VCKLDVGLIQLRDISRLAFIAVTEALALEQRISILGDEVLGDRSWDIGEDLGGRREISQGRELDGRIASLVEGGGIEAITLLSQFRRNRQLNRCTSFTATMLSLPAEVVAPGGPTHGVIVGTLGCPSTVIAVCGSSTAAAADDHVHVNNFLVRSAIASVAAVVRRVVGAAHN
jgi:hypothetical protein